jgi:hypothetical protein
MPKKKPKFSKFEIPEAFLETLYELTGGKDNHKGYIVCFIDEEGNGQVKSRYDSQATEFALLKFLEVYSENNLNSHEIENIYPSDFLGESEEDD